MKNKNLIWPITFLFGCIILGGFYYASQTHKPKVNNKEPSTSSFIFQTGIGLPEVKKSSTGICHGKSSTFYDKTINFTPYSSITDCLASGGRLPKK